MFIRLLAVGALFGSAALVPPLVAQEMARPAVTVNEEKPGLLTQARISPDSATKVAQGRLTKAVIQSAEIEVEDGHLMYSFDMKQPGKSGIEEVQVDAHTGKVLGVEHEDAAAEAREKSADSTKGKP